MTMQVETERMVPITKLQKELTGKIRELGSSDEPLFIMKNNTLAAVILAPADYEILKEAENLLEHLEIADLIDRRLKSHKRVPNIPWEKVKAKRGL
jgi:PHD/YefM family antitoxin component YafN of YafNO toxin-antitoxin module